MASTAALTQGVGFAFLSGRTILSITGSDRTSFLHAFCTNNIKALTPGRGCEAFITNPQGKTLGYVLVFCEPNQLLIDTSATAGGRGSRTFIHYVLSEDVQFIDRSAELCDVLIAGASGRGLISKLTGSDAADRAARTSRRNVSGGRDDSPCRIRRAGCYFMQVSAADASTVMNAFRDTGTVHCNDVAVEAARLEAGIPLFGSNITPDRPGGRS